METDSIEVIEEQVVTKIFKVRLGNQLITLDDKQASVLYNQLKEKFQKEEQSLKLNSIAQKASALGYIPYEDTLIPVGYKPIAVRESNPRNGKSVHHYHYFKDSKGNFGFLIKNGMTKPFARIGKIEDPNSILWKVLHTCPKTKPITKSYFVNKGLVNNNQRMKAIMDILLLEGYLKERKIPNSKIINYLVTQKIEELEFENSIEPLKVQNSPTHNKIIGVVR